MQNCQHTIQAPTDMCIITTYRCPMRCQMCDIWQNPTEKSKEIQPKELEILPHVKFVNITGGEPFIREDLDEIVEVLLRNLRELSYPLLDGLKIESFVLLKNFPK